MDGCRRALAGCMLAAVMLLSGGATAYAQNANPTVTASRTPTGAVRVGVPIQFTAVGADADNDALTYAWTFGDNTTSTEQNPSKTYLAAGTFTATVTVSDGKGGSGTASLTGISIQANRAPSITVGSATPAAGVVPFTTQLAATATDADGHAVTYAWDLDGDGTFETTERNPSLNLTSAGDKVVTLRASDAFGGVGHAGRDDRGSGRDPRPDQEVQRARLLEDRRVPPRLDRPGHHGDQAARPAEQHRGRRDRGRHAVHRRLPRPL